MRLTLKRALALFLALMLAAPTFAFAEEIDVMGLPVDEIVGTVDAEIGGDDDDAGLTTDYSPVDEEAPTPARDENISATDTDMPAESEGAPAESNTPVEDGAPAVDADAPDANDGAPVESNAPIEDGAPAADADELTTENAVPTVEADAPASDDGAPAESNAPVEDGAPAAEADAPMEGEGASAEDAEAAPRLEYVFKGDAGVALAEIMEAMGFSGEVAAVEVSNPELILATDETGEWIIMASEPFTTEEWIKVTVGEDVIKISLMYAMEAGTVDEAAEALPSMDSEETEEVEISGEIANVAACAEALEAAYESYLRVNVDYPDYCDVTVTTGGTTQSVSNDRILVQNYANVVVTATPKQGATLDPSCFTLYGGNVSPEEHGDSYTLTFGMSDKDETVNVSVFLPDTAVEVTVLPIDEDAGTVSIGTPKGEKTLTPGLKRMAAEAEEGDNVTITAAPNAGYCLLPGAFCYGNTRYYDGVLNGNGGARTYTITKGDDKISVNVTFAPSAPSFGAVLTGNGQTTSYAYSSNQNLFGGNKGRWAFIIPNDFNPFGDIQDGQKVVYTRENDKSVYQAGDFVYPYDDSVALSAELRGTVPVILPNVTGGKVSSNVTAAAAGQEIVITATIDEGYSLIENITATYEGGYLRPTGMFGTTTYAEYRFAMPDTLPASAITINASICKISGGDNGNTGGNGDAGGNGDTFEPIPIDADHFSDGTFRNYVSSRFDRYTGEGNYQQGADGQLSKYEIETVATAIDLKNTTVASLDGLQYFTALDFLDCSGCTSITSLNVSGFTALRQLVCHDGALSELNVEGCEGLQTLDCWNNASLTTLNLTGLSALYHLDCSDCGLTSLTVSGCTALSDADIHDNALTSVNMSDSPLILAVCVPDNKKVRFRDNNSETDAFMQFGDRSSGACLTLDYGTAIPPLDGLEIAPVPIDSAHFPDDTFRNVVKGFDRYQANGAVGADDSLCEKDAVEARFISLNTFDSAAGKVTGMGIALLDGIQHLKWLEDLDCNYNELTALDLSGMSHLKTLYCAHNQLETVNLSGCSSLESIHANANKFKTLDISECAPKLLGICVPNAVEVWQDDDGTFYTGYNGYRVDVNNTVSVSYDYGVTLITEKDSGGGDSGGDNGGGDNGGSNGGSGTPAPEPPAADAPAVAPIAVTQTQVIAVSSAAMKTVMTAAPGTTAQIETGAKAGKSFKSSKKKVATVSSTGLVTIKGAGKTKITFKVGKKKRTLTLTVKDPTIPTLVTLSASGPLTGKKGESVTLTPVIPDGTDAGGYKWKSSNKSVATVRNGVVTFKKAGKATITCTARRGKKKARVKVVVTK